MSNFKLVKTAAALALGASVVTSAVATTDASAASKYKIKSGKLVYAKSGKVVKGYVTYKSTVYKNGKKLTGLKGKTYYKAGKKATGTYKGAYYVKGAKKVTTGTYNKAYYVKGVKKVSTGIYNKKYYKYGKVATGTYKGAYYVKGLKKVTTGTYNGAYYVKGKKVVSTGLYADKLYVDGKLNKGYKLYKEDLYKDAVLNTELALFEGKLYDGAKLNEGHKIFKDELYNGSELNTKLALFEGKLYDGAKLNEGIKKFEDKWYNNAELADGTFTDEGVEKAFENGVEVGAKVKSVEAINATQVKVTFNKSVDEATVNDASTKTLITNNISFKGVKAGAQTVAAQSAVVDGNTVIYTVDHAPVDEYTVVIDNLKTTGKEEIARYSKVVKFAADAVAPSVIGTERISSTKVKVKFSEPIAAYTIADFKYADGSTAKVDSVNVAAGSTEATLDLSKADEAKDITVTLVGVQDLAGNLINPNPTTFTVSKTKVDGILPEVTEIKQTGAKTFTVSFSKKVAKGQVLLNGTPATVAPVTKDAEYDTTFEVTAPSVLGGLYNLGINGFADIDNQAVKEVTKVFTFTKDEAAPSVVSSKVVVKEDGSKNAEFIELTFDRVVTEGKVTVSGKSVKDYVTTDVDSKEVDAKYATVKAGETQDKKVLLVKATDFATEEGAAYDVKFDLSKIKSETDVAAKEATVKFVKAKETDVVAENKDVFAKTDITVEAVDKAPSNVKITFSKAVDGASATNIANYNVAGSVVESAVLTQVDGKSVVTLTLKAGSSTFDGARNVTVSNVKVKGSTQAMGTETYVVVLKHNILPVLQTASLATTNTVVLTFAKDVTEADLKLFSGKNELVIATDAPAVDAKPEVPAVIDPDTGDETTPAVPAVPAKPAVKGIDVKGNIVTITTKDAVTAELVKAGLTVSGTVTDANGNALKLVDQPVK